MKIPLPELGLDCEKLKCNIHGHRNSDLGGCNCFEVSIYNQRTAENENSVLVIDEEKQAMIMWQKFSSKVGFYPVSAKECVEMVKYLSQNAKSFMRIEKEEHDSSNFSK